MDLSPPAPRAIRIAAVEQFDEPRFSELAERIFGDNARRALLDTLIGAEERERATGLRGNLPQPARLRIGAFDGADLVGWTTGWFEPGGLFYVANSAVLPEYRRRGIYSALVTAMREQVAARGGFVIHSKHRADNNPVLIAKLRLGFVIHGMEFSEELGLLVKLICHLNPGRAELYAQRIGMLERPAPDRPA